MWRKVQSIPFSFPQKILVRDENNVLVDQEDSKELAKMPNREDYTLEVLLAGNIPLDQVPLNLSDPENEQNAMEESEKFMNEVEQAESQKMNNNEI